jgi:hypothetical protein
LTDYSKWLRAGYTPEQARVIAEWLRSERRRLKQAPGKLFGRTEEKLNVPRFARNAVQRKQRRFLKYQPRNLPKLLLASRYVSNPLLDGLFPKRAARWTPVLRRPLVDDMPELDLRGFSFVHNPIATIESLSALIEMECTYARARLNFLDQECLDIGSYLVLQAVRRHIAPVFEGGKISQSSQKVIDAVGLRNALNMAPFRNLRDHENVWPFPLQLRRAGKAQSAGRYIEPQKKEHVADSFVQTVNDWLNVVAEQMLSLDGRRLVLKMIGEALDNAERHSVLRSDDGDWAITGFLSKAGIEESRKYRCHLAFLSLGATVAESVRTSPPSTLQKMDDYVLRHSGRVAPDALRTVFALQDGVTKDAEAFAEGRGGTGFQDIFEFFADLGGSQSSTHYARLAIVSGNVCIHAYGRYLKGMRKGGMDSERELWFNHQNDPIYAPESAHVFELPRRLNGTLVTMVIDLDEAYLEESADAAN